MTTEGIPAPEGATRLIDTGYVIGQDNIVTRKWGLNLDLHGIVFTLSSLVILVFVTLTLALQAEVGPVFDAVFSFVTGNLSWVFLLGSNLFVLVGVVLIFTPLGRVRIGGTDARPEFSYAGWLAMLFAAGMGIGLMFYGVAEPLTHFGTAMGGVSVDNGVRTDWAPLGAQDAALELQLFVMLGELPLAAITSFVGIVLVIVFFVTSSDSGSLVIDAITAGGKVDAPKSQRIFWATIEGAVAIALLLGGGLKALQSAAVSTGLPFTLVLMVACYALVKALLDEPRE